MSVGAELCFSTLEFRFLIFLSCVLFLYISMCAVIASRELLLSLAGECKMLLLRIFETWLSALVACSVTFDIGKVN